MNAAKRQKLRSAKACFGTWIASGSPVVTELAALCGLDWLLLDMEHGYLTEVDLLPSLQAAGGRTAAIAVRVPTHDAGLIGRTLDRGADAIMAPHVESAKEAKALVRAMCFPPHGARGFSRSVRACDYGLHTADEADRPLLFAQIESVAGLNNVEAIAAVEGVDVLFVGPADLKLSLSTVSGAPDYGDALARVNRAATASGIQTGILVRDRTETEALQQLGFNKVAIDSDLSLLKAGFLSIAQNVHP